MLLRPVTGNRPFHWDDRHRYHQIWDLATDLLSRDIQPKKEEALGFIRRLKQYRGVDVFREDNLLKVLLIMVAGEHLVSEDSTGIETLKEMVEVLPGNTFERPVIQQDVDNHTFSVRSDDVELTLLFTLKHGSLDWLQRLEARAVEMFRLQEFPQDNIESALIPIKLMARSWGLYRNTPHLRLLASQYEKNWKQSQLPAFSEEKAGELRRLADLWESEQSTEDAPVESSDISPAAGGEDDSGKDGSGEDTVRGILSLEEIEQLSEKFEQFNFYEQQFWKNILPAGSTEKQTTDVKKTIDTLPAGILERLMLTDRSEKADRLFYEAFYGNEEVLISKKGDSIHIQWSPSGQTWREQALENLKAAAELGHGVAELVLALIAEAELELGGQSSNHLPAQRTEQIVQRVRSALQRGQQQAMEWLWHLMANDTAVSDTAGFLSLLNQGIPKAEAAAYPSVFLNYCPAGSECRTFSTHSDESPEVNGSPLMMSIFSTLADTNQGDAGKASALATVLQQIPDHVPSVHSQLLASVIRQLAPELELSAGTLDETGGGQAVTSYRELMKKQGSWSSLLERQSKLSKQTQFSRNDEAQLVALILKSDGQVFVDLITHWFKALRERMSIPEDECPKVLLQEASDIGGLNHYIDSVKLAKLLHKNKQTLLHNNVLTADAVHLWQQILLWRATQQGSADAPARWSEWFDDENMAELAVTRYLEKLKDPTLGDSRKKVALLNKALAVAECTPDSHRIKQFVEAQLGPLELSWLSEKQLGKVDKVTGSERVLKEVLGHVEQLFSNTGTTDVSGGDIILTPLAVLLSNDAQIRQKWLMYFRKRATAETPYQKLEASTGLGSLFTCAGVLLATAGENFESGFKLEKIPQEHLPLVKKLLTTGYKLGANVAGMHISFLAEQGFGEHSA